MIQEAVKMKTAIIYKSIHYENTKKIAKVMADALEARLLELKDAMQILSVNLIQLVWFYNTFRKTS
jgi:flavodoxin